MATNPELLKTAVEETLRLQNTESAEYEKWLHVPHNSFPPPSVPTKNGRFYPTTDMALISISEIVDNIRINNKNLSRRFNRDAMFQKAILTFGEFLPSLANIPDDQERWLCYRDALDTDSQLIISQTIYIPVWLFVRQEYEDFSFGPVEFVDRSGWLKRVATLLGSRPIWLSKIEATWGLSEIVDGGVQDSTNQHLIFQFNTVLRFAHEEQRIACVAISGFDVREAKRRALLATRIAIDAIRLLLPEGNKKKIFTSADHGPPFSIDHLRQIAGRDLISGWELARPGVGGAPGMVQKLIENSTKFREAAGNCIKVIISSDPTQESLPLLSERWSNAIHWYGRACCSDADFVALPMVGFALDILCVGKEEAGIRNLACVLLEKTESDLVNGTGLTLKVAVRKVYEWRSRIAHGTMLAVDQDLASDRIFAESLANELLYRYVVNLNLYRASASPKDEYNNFLEWIKNNPLSGRCSKDVDLCIVD